jgi:hypothetical protein
MNYWKEPLAKLWLLGSNNMKALQPSSHVAWSKFLLGSETTETSF